MCKARRADSPKKHVTFGGLDKENGDWYSLEMPEDNVVGGGEKYKNIESKLEMEHRRNMIDLRAKLRQAKLKSEELRRHEVESRFRGHQITGLR